MRLRAKSCAKLSLRRWAGRHGKPTWTLALFSVLMFLAEFLPEITPILCAVASDKAVSIPPRRILEHRQARFVLYLLNLDLSQLETDDVDGECLQKWLLTLISSSY